MFRRRTSSDGYPAGHNSEYAEVEVEIAVNEAQRTVTGHWQLGRCTGHEANPHGVRT